ncbi:VOC family protein [Yinghuangia seranimata]|uniref:VOC family protein n=1 Tax=Yinghuangia seranimata TaxID=408067 RepID=UPI00248C2F3D|nr:VOC family protein [Yinghuangia seranimata]MDI2126025.1 VOC family protein [Yinghuangia seranimata]
MITPPNFPTGIANWIDLGSPDIDAHVAFYNAIFGWSFQSLGPEAGNYGFFQVGGKTLAAIGPLTEEGATPAWTVYFTSPSAEDATASVEKAGGSVRVPPFDVMTAGRMACLTDPTGAEFSTWQPGDVAGVDVACEPNTLLWVELHSTDPQAALDFYKAVYGWRSEVMDAPGMQYIVVSPSESSGNPQTDGFGGIAPVMAEGQPSSWTPYFYSEDPDALSAKVEAAGGSVLMPADEVPDVGRIAWYADPFGAVFAVLKPNPPAAG